MKLCASVQKGAAIEEVSCGFAVVQHLQIKTCACFFCSLDDCMALGARSHCFTLLPGMLQTYAADQASEEGRNPLGLIRL